MRRFGSYPAVTMQFTAPRAGARVPGLGSAAGRSFQSNEA